MNMGNIPHPTRTTPGVQPAARPGATRTTPGVQPAARPGVSRVFSVRLPVLFCGLLLAGCGGGAFAGTPIPGLPPEEVGTVLEIDIRSEGAAGRTPAVAARTLTLLPGREERVECVRTYRYVSGVQTVNDATCPVEREIELGVKIRLALTEKGALDWSAQWDGLEGRSRFANHDGIDIEMPLVAAASAEGRIEGARRFRLVLPSPWSGDPERIVLDSGGVGGGIEVRTVDRGDPKRFLLPGRGRAQAKRTLCRVYLNLTDFDVEVAQSAFICSPWGDGRTGFVVDVRDGIEVRLTHSRVVGMVQGTLGSGPPLFGSEYEIERKRITIDGPRTVVAFPPAPDGRPNSLTIARVSR